MRRLVLTVTLACGLVAAAASPVMAESTNVPLNITPCLHEAALPGVFGALFGSQLEANTTVPNGWIADFAQRHSDPAAGDCEP